MPLAPSSLKALLLTGGRSSRMGSPKHLLPFHDRPLYLHVLELLQTFCHGTDKIYISVNRPEQATGFKLPMSWQDRVTFLYDEPSQDDSIPYITAKAKPDDNGIGPAAGLLAAYKNDPHAHWLVIACDYPLLTSDALQQLYDAYEEPVTCFVNSQGWLEPLLGIWGPYAISKLKSNVGRGYTGPSMVVKELQGRLIKPAVDLWIKGANTKEEWADILELVDDTGKVP